MHTLVAQSIFYIGFLMSVATIQCLNYTGQQSKKQNLQCMFLTHVRLETGHSYQTWYESVDSKQI